MSFSPTYPFQLPELPPNVTFTDEKIIALLLKARTELGELKGYTYSIPNPMLLLSPAILKEAIAELVNANENKDIKVNEQEVSTVKIDQDYDIDKFIKSCEKRKLVKKKSIPANILYEIGKEIYPDEMPKSQSAFKDGNKFYHKLRTNASLTGYKKTRGT